MDSKLVKQSVVESYGKLAKAAKDRMFSRLFACCDANENANQVGKIIGYTEKELNSVPENSNLGVGCGNPSALAHIEVGETVIDLGSGAGFDAFIVSAIVGSSGKVIGIDLSADMLDLARNNTQKGSYTNVEFVEGNLLDPSSLQSAVQGVEQLYHLAAMFAIWTKDPDLHFKINVDGAGTGE